MTSSSPYKPSLGLRRTAPFQQDGRVPLPGLTLCSQPGPTSPTVWSRQLPGPEPEAQVQPRGQQSPAPLEGGKWGAGFLGQSQVLGASARYQDASGLPGAQARGLRPHKEPQVCFEVGRETPPLGLGTCLPSATFSGISESLAGVPCWLCGGVGAWIPACLRQVGIRLFEGRGPCLNSY